ALQQGDQKSRMFNRFENRYQWPLALGLVLLLISLAIPEMGLSSSPADVGAQPLRRWRASAEASVADGGSMDPRQRNSGMTAFKALALMVCVSSLSQASQSQLKEGNRQFKNGNYDKALKLYDDALIDAPYSSI